METSQKNLIKLIIVLLVALGALLYGGGYIAQFLYNYDVWQAAGNAAHTASI